MNAQTERLEVGERYRLSIWESCKDLQVLFVGMREGEYDFGYRDPEERPKLIPVEEGEIISVDGNKVEARSHRRVLDGDDSLHRKLLEAEL